jgi:hypothetical protein
MYVFSKRMENLVEIEKKKNIRKQLRMKVKKKIKLKKIENQANMDEHFKLS